MNEIILDDSQILQDFFPFTLTRSVADIRIGILTIKEKWEQFFNFHVHSNSNQEASIPVIPANIIPDHCLIDSILSKKQDRFTLSPGNTKKIEYPWHIFQMNEEIIRSDFTLITYGRESQPVSSTNKVINPEKIFIERGGKAEYCFLNASHGPIYIGKNAEIMEGSMIRGPFALCENALVKMGTKIYGSTVGPYSVVGGEIKNSVIFGYSNKAHDGYLGDSVIGAWCNLGAGTSNSNLKNSAAEIKIWNEFTKKDMPVGLKCGLLMGDYSRCAINTSFNTATVVGVCCNVFGQGLTPKNIPSFSWGFSPLTKYKFQQALQDIANWKRLKHQSLIDIEIQTLKNIFEQY